MANFLFFKKREWVSEWVTKSFIYIDEQEKWHAMKQTVLNSKYNWYCVHERTFCMCFKNPTNVCKTIQRMLCLYQLKLQSFHWFQYRALHISMVSANLIFFGDERFSKRCDERIAAFTIESMLYLIYINLRLKEKKNTMKPIVKYMKKTIIFFYLNVIIFTHTLCIARLFLTVGGCDIWQFKGL